MGSARQTGQHTPAPGHRAEALYAACTDYRRRLGWPVCVDQHGQEVVLLTGEALVGGSQIGDQVVVVDMPADMGSRVSTVLWTRSLPAVVFAVQRLVYVHPYRHTRWCFLALADSSGRYDNLDGLHVPLLDVQVIRDQAVALPLRRVERGAAQSGVAGPGKAVPARSWVLPPPADNVRGRALPRLTAVLAGVCEVVGSGRT